MAETQEEHPLKPVAERVVIGAFRREAGEILFDHAEAFLRTLILRSLGDVVLLFLAFGLHVELTRTEGLLHKTQTGHGDAGAVNVAQFHAI